LCSPKPIHSYICTETSFKKSSSFYFKKSIYSSTRNVAGIVAFLQFISAFSCRLTVTKRNKIVDNTKWEYKKADTPRYILKENDKSWGFINGMNAVIFSSDYKLFKFCFHNWDSSENNVWNLIFIGHMLPRCWYIFIYVHKASKIQLLSLASLTNVIVSETSSILHYLNEVKYIGLLVCVYVWMYT
jgi:hypothetical protein